MQEALSKEELDERIAILRRFRSLLEQQRDKFRAYLRVLELQEPQITGDDAALLNEHTELGSLLVDVHGQNDGRQLVHDIGELQKVIVPMQALYRSRHAAACSPAEAVPVEQLQEELDRLQEKALAQNKRNQQLLRTRLPEVRRELTQFKNPYRAHQSVYAEKDGSGSFIHINA